MIIACITFVLSILLKLNPAPARKKSTNQNSNFAKNYGAEVETNNLAIVFPVMMHLDTEVPNKYTEIAIIGKMPHLSPNNILN